VSDRYVVISADGHCGASLLDYKPHLEKRFHDDFDAWASTYVDAWGQRDDAYPDSLQAGLRLGFASFENPLNWDSALRLAHTEEQGIAAEVLFPNTSPPFFPTGAITAPGPRSREEYEHRFAGLKAHNRWLAEFCQEAPGRRAGFAQVFLDDIDDAIAEIRWAKEAGLRGVILPGDHVLKLANLYYPALDPFWATCEELELPVHRHAIRTTEVPEIAGPGGVCVAIMELSFYVMRGLAHMICAGVFEKFPSLKYVQTETPDSRELLPFLEHLDLLYQDPKLYESKGATEMVDAVSLLTRAPSEYFSSNCNVAGPFDLRLAYELGLRNIMWGADIPHAEGTSPVSLASMRYSFAGLPQTDVKQMTSELAADVYGFDLVELQKVADRIGPTETEMSTPLDSKEVHEYSETTRCQIFAYPRSIPLTPAQGGPEG